MAIEEKTNKTNKLERIYALLAGSLAGLINGIFGGGGGMIIVPMLVMLLKYKQKKAHATAILIILPFSIISSLLYSAFGSLKIDVALPVGVGVVAGGILGAILLSKLSNKWLVIIFSVIMAIAGAKMLLF